MKSWLMVALLAMVVVFAWLFQILWQPFDAWDMSASEEMISKNGQRLSQLRDRVQVNDITSLAPKPLTGDEVDRGLDWLSQGNVDDALIYFREDIAGLSDELNFVQRLAEELLRLGRYEDSLSVLYEFRLFVLFEKEEALLESIFNFVARIDALLEDQEDFQRLVDLYRLLLGWHADHSPYYLRLAYWQIQLGDYESARQTLLGVANDIEYSQELERLTELLASLSGEAPAPGAIPLIKENEQYSLEVVLPDGLNANLMLDTGAGMTVIKPELVDRIGSEYIKERGEVLLNTANGPVTARKVALASLTLGSLDLPETEIALLPLENLNYDGLLGMNVLSQFEFFIDQNNQVMYIK